MPVAKKRQSNFAPAAFVIFAVAFTLRIIHIWQMRNAPFFTLLMGDARGYDEWAQRIAGGDWIGRDVFYQAPLYPYFLASIYWIAGRSPALVRIAQALIGSCSCVLIALAARRLFPARAGLLAGLMLAVYAPAIFFDGLLQKSVLDVFFLCLALLLIAQITVRLKPDTTSDVSGVTGNAGSVTRNIGSVRLQADRDQPSLRSSRSPRSGIWLALGVTMGALAL